VSNNNDTFLQTTFDSLGAQTAQMAMLGSELEIAQHLNK